MALTLAASAAGCQVIAGIGDSTPEAPDAGGVDGAASDDAIPDTVAALDAHLDGSSPETAADARIDAADPEAAPPGITAINTPTVIEATKTAQIGATITGAPNGTVQIAWRAAQNGGGTFSPSQGPVQLDGTGNQVLVTTYTAPALRGTFDQTFTVLSAAGQAAKSFTLNVAVPTYVGYPNAFNPAGTLTTGSSYLFGEQVSVSFNATVVRLGFISGAAAQNAQLAIYSDIGGTPNALVANTPIFSVVKGVNEITVAQPALLPTGAYWIMAIFSTATLALQSTGSNSTSKYIAFSIGTVLPATFPSPMTTSVGTYNFYAVVLN